MSSWKHTAVYVVILVAVTTGYRVWSDRAGPRLEENLAKAEADAKSKLNLPAKIDATTTLVDLKFGPTSTSYWYVSDVALNPLEVERDIKSQVCANSELVRTIKEKGYSYEYHYMNKARATLATFKIAACP